MAGDAMKCAIAQAVRRAARASRMKRLIQAPLVELRPAAGMFSPPMAERERRLIDAWLAARGGGA
jgi:hypothetical protein